MSSDAATAPETTDDARATIGRASTIHRASAEVVRDRFDPSIIVTYRVYGTACGTDVRRGRRSTFAAQPRRYAVDCARCLAQD